MPNRTVKLQGKISIIATMVIIAVVVIIATILYLNVQTQKISDVKTQDNVGKVVKVRGEVKSVIKIGQLSGYTLEDASGTIAVSSEDLPKEGDTMTVKGTLIKDTLLGYYIKVN